jgi:hypothetical protein
MGTGEFISYGTLSAMSRMENTRFIIMEDGEASHWAVKNRELETLLKNINKWASKRIMDGFKISSPP